MNWMMAFKVLLEIPSVPGEVSFFNLFAIEINSDSVMGKRYIDDARLGFSSGIDSTLFTAEAMSFPIFKNNY